MVKDTEETKGKKRKRLNKRFKKIKKKSDSHYYEFIYEIDVSLL